MANNEKECVDQKAAKIDEKVYQDTIEQHQEKHKLDSMIEDLDKDIEELMRVLERKKKERSMLVLEKEVHQRKIQQARMKYQDKIDSNESELQKISQTLATLDKT